MPADASRRTVTVVGRGLAEVPPDEAEVTVGVDAVRPSAGEARSAAAGGMERVVGALRDVGLTAEDVRTSSLSLTPEVEYLPAGPARRTGFRVSNRVTARVRRLDDLAGVVDAAVEAGATTVEGIRYRVIDERSARRAALSSAVAEARAAAEAVAGAAGERLGPVRAVREVVGGSAPVPRFAVMEAAAGTPVLPGLATVEAVVEVSWEFEA